MNKKILVLIVSALLANFAGIAVSAADEKNQPAKPVVVKNNDKSLIITDKISTDPVENAKLAKEILGKGKENLKRINYKSTYVDDTNGKKGTRIICNKSNPDGTNDYRYENSVEGAFYTSLMIRNRDGNFDIYRNTAVKSTFDDGYDGMSEQGEQAAYSLSEGSHRGIPCYVITKKIQPDEGRYDSYLKHMEKVLVNKYTAAQLKNSFESAFPTIEVFHIGKNDGFIYEYTYYNVRGQKAAFTNYGDVELNASLDDKLFEIPDNFIIRIANNPTEFNDITGDLLYEMAKNNRQRLNDSKKKP
jgi:hypothetical protein